MMPPRLPITVSGAGPAGLSAAITVVRAGAPALVYDRHEAVGHRFHGDFQGLENWTTEVDVLDELAALGIEPTFECTPFREAVLYDPNGREYLCRDSQPLFYLVRRGPGEESLDQGLQRQALSLGVELRLGTPCRHLPEGSIVAEGPKRADVIAVGHLFETDAADGAFCVLSGQLSAQAYAYLIVHRGQGVVATCLFEDFHNERYYLGRTVEFFQNAIGLTMRHVRRFGGVGNFSVPATARNGGMLYVGECAGFQDALAGFGLRYALISGHLAAKALLEGEARAYDGLWRSRFGSELRAATVNRYLYAALGDAARRFLARQIAGSSGVRTRLRRRYANSALKALLYPIARRSVDNRLRIECVAPGCDCTWCRCHGGEAVSRDKARPVPIGSH
jgi:flavin-dependent dehydrogenase